MTRNSPLALAPDPARWDEWLAAHDGHILQSSGWGELKSRFHWHAERVEWRAQGEVRGAAQILYRRLAPGLTLAYVPRGPLVPDAQELAPFLAQLGAYVRSKGAFALKLEPDWRQGDARDAALGMARLRPAAETIQPPTTIHIDLTGELDSILARMKPKWRYNIRLAAKKDVTVRAGTAEDVPAFYELLQLTAERDDFAIHSLAYYRAAFDQLAACDRARLFIAEHEKQPLAMIFVTAFAQEAIYLYGASSNAERNRMPNHALHWAAIQWAKARGCTRYDLWGIPAGAAGSDDKKDTLPSSLHQFKQGFGGAAVRYTGAWDAVYNPLAYKVYQLARRMRKGNPT